MEKESGGIDIEVVILTHKRWETITTHKAVNGAKICVPESQLSQYRERIPDAEYIVHPDSVKGLSAKRQWVYDKFPNVFMLDDDISGVHAVHRDGEKVSPQFAYEIIQWAGNVCSMMGKFFFGFSQYPNVSMYNAFRPIKNTGFINGCAFGLLEGSGLKFRNDIVAVEDYYISGMNAYQHRSAFIDLRFNFRQTDTFKGKGGQSDFRTMETEKADLILLRRLFGDSIHIKRSAKVAANKNRYGRSLIVPY